MWLAVFLFLVLACRAEQLPVHRYSIADGLAGNRVESILADSHGFLWFGTADGLSRFDGYQFTNFTSTEGLPGNSVSKIIESGSGAYWIATNHGPCRFDPKRRGQGSRFTAFALKSRANTLLEGRDGAIWCGTFSGLYRLLRGHAAFEWMPRFSSASSPASDHTTMPIATMTTSIEPARTRAASPMRWRRSPKP